MNILALLSFFAFLVFMLIGITIYRAEPRSTLHRLFFGVCLSAAVWAFSYVFFLSAANVETATLWRRISAPGWVFLFSLHLHFILLLTKAKSIFNKKWFYIVNYLPPVFFLFVFSSNYWLHNGEFIQTFLGWIFIDPPGLWIGHAFVFYFSAILLTIIAVTWRWGAKSTFFRRKKQARVLVLTHIIAFIAGSLTDAFLPMAGLTDFPPLAVVIILIPLLGTWYSITKYRLMAVNPNSFSEDILEHMTEGLLIINTEGLIKSANPSAMRIFGRTEKTLFNQNICDLLPQADIKLPLNIDAKPDLAGDGKSFVIYGNEGVITPVTAKSRIIYDRWDEINGMAITLTDNTERLKADELLQQERAFFENLFHSVPVGIVLLDVNDRVQDCNEEFTNLFHFSKEEILNKPINDLIVPLNLTEEATGFSVNVAGGALVNQDSIRQRKDGSLVEVNIIGKPIQTEKGQIAIIGIYQDITERRRFHEALEYERDLLQALMDNIPDTIYFKDIQSRFTRINKAQAKMLGIKDVSKAFGKTDFDFFDWTAAEKQFAGEQDLLKSGLAMVNQLEFLESAGKKRWMSATKVPIRDHYGSIVGLVGVSRDVTRLKQIEESLRSRERFLTQINIIINFALRQLNSQNLYEFLSDHMKKLFSADFCFITGWDEINEQTIPLVASGMDRDQYHRLAKTGGEITLTASVLKVAKPLVVEDAFNSPYISLNIARLFPVKSVLALPMIADDSKMGAVLIGFSNTYKFTEEEIEYGLMAAKQIAIVVNKLKMFEQLSKNKEELQKLNAEKDKLFSIIAHDLRSPFTSFLGLTELMADDSYDLSAEEMRKFAAAMHGSANNLMQLLENLLSWSRIQGGTSSFNPERLDFNETAQAAVEMFSENARRKDIQINNHISSRIFINADKRMIQSLLGNLISNAIKFTHQNGRVELSAKVLDESWMEAAVTDTGVGMNEQQLAKLFKLDEKVNSQGTAGEPSSGLGLILCGEFVEKHKGRLRAESSPGEGTTIYFTLPLAKP